MYKRVKYFILGLMLLAALALGALSTAPTFSSHGVGISPVPPAYAAGCDEPHPPPWLDCPGSTPTPTPPPGH